MYLLYCKTLLLVLRWDTVKVRHRLRGIVRFKGGSTVAVDIISVINYSIQIILNASTI